MVFSTFCRAQVTLSAGLAAFSHIIRLFAIPQSVKDHLCAALVDSVFDCKLQNWEEMTAPAFNVLNYIGALRKNKHATVEESSPVDIGPFEFDRFKRHMQGLLERACRLAGNRTASIDKDDVMESALSANEALEEEEDIGEAETADAAESTPNKAEEESDWTCDVKQTMDLLPRL